MSLEDDANPIYEDPIYELTEENTSGRFTPQKIQSSRDDRSYEEMLSLGRFATVNTIPERGRKLLIVTIEIGNGEQENLTIFENDNPQDVAREFCKRHGIDNELQEIIALHIENSIHETKSKLLMRDRSPSYATASMMGLENESMRSSGSLQKRNERKLS